MASALVLSPQDVSTSLNYAAPAASGSERYRYIDPAPQGVPTSHEPHETRNTTIHDLRGHEDFASLDTTGFQFVHHESAEKDFVDDEEIKDVYYKEVEELLKQYTGAKKVVIFDHTIRRRVVDEGPGKRGPVERVHVDQTFESGPLRVFRHLPADEATRLLKSRVRIINVWRPISHPVHHNPLALLDYRTVSIPGDLVTTRFIYNDPKIGNAAGVYGVTYSPAHRWYYLREQTPEEITFIKCFDSLDEGEARFTPHSAFLDKTSPAGAPRRESIEVRALVFDEE